MKSFHRRRSFHVRRNAQQSMSCPSPKPKSAQRYLTADTTDSEMYSVSVAHHQSRSNHHRQVAVRNSIPIHIPETTDSEYAADENRQLNPAAEPIEELTYSTNDWEQDEFDVESKLHQETNGSPQKRKIKSEQNLPWRKSTKRLTQSSEQHISIRPRRCLTAHGKKSPTLAEHVHLVVSDSDCTSDQLPRRKDQRSSREKMSKSADSENRTRFNEDKVHEETKEHLKPQEVLTPRFQPDQLDSARTNTDATVADQSTIPVKTQQLLNKSYWEYYNKLKVNDDDGAIVGQRYVSQIAVGAPKNKRRRANASKSEVFNHSAPEVRVLEQCSVLSSMINHTL